MNQIQFQTKLHLNGHGSDDYESDQGDAYTITALLNGVSVGYVDFNFFKVEVTEFLEESILHIRWVEVAQNWQRQGVAAKLLDEMQAQFPSALMETNGVTLEGRKFLDAYEDGEVFVNELTRV